MVRASSIQAASRSGGNRPDTAENRTRSVGRIAGKRGSTRGEKEIVVIADDEFYLVVGGQPVQVGRIVFGCVLRWKGI